MPASYSGPEPVFPVSSAVICAIPVLSVANPSVTFWSSPVTFWSSPVTFCSRPVIFRSWSSWVSRKALRAWVCAQLSANLRHVTIGTGRQHAGADSVRAAERDLLAKPDDLVLQDGHPGLDVVGGVRHGVMQTTEHVEMLRSSRTLVGWDSHARVRSTACSTVRGAGKRPILVDNRRKASRLIQLKPTVGAQRTRSPRRAGHWRRRPSLADPGLAHQFLVLQLGGKLQRTVDIDHRHTQWCSGRAERCSAVLVGSGPDRSLNACLKEMPRSRIRCLISAAGRDRA